MTAYYDLRATSCQVDAYFSNPSPYGMTIAGGASALLTADGDAGSVHWAGASCDGGIRVQFEALPSGVTLDPLVTTYQVRASYRYDTTAFAFGTNPHFYYCKVPEGSPFTVNASGLIQTPLPTGVYGDHTIEGSTADVDYPFYADPYVKATDVASGNVLAYIAYTASGKADLWLSQIYLHVAVDAPQPNLTATVGASRVRFRRAR